jgi:hypothetical protein
MATVLPAFGFAVKTEVCDGSAAASAQWAVLRRAAGDTLGASPRPGGVIMHARDRAEAVEVLNLLLKFFGDGKRWIKGRFSDRRGNCCLVGALDFVSGHHAIKGEAAERYLADAISDERERRVRYQNGEDYARLRAALRRAMRGEWYRASDALMRRDSLSDFNDACKDFAELRAVIVRARATAMNDTDPAPAPRSRRDIECDELVMA